MLRNIAPMINLLDLRNLRAKNCGQSAFVITNCSSEICSHLQSARNSSVKFYRR